MYSAAVKIASVVMFLMFVFREWRGPCSRTRSKTTARCWGTVLVRVEWYLLVLASWLALALGALSPWLVELLTNPRYQRAEKGVPLLAFAVAIYAGYTVLAIGSGRARRTQLNWVVTGTGAAVNIGLNFWLIPRWGMVGAAISTAAAYVVLFVGMTWYAQHVYPVPYQWRRIVTVVGAAVGLTVAARATHLSLAPSFLLVLVVSARARRARVLPAGGAEAIAKARADVSLGGFGEMVLVAGVRWSVRGKDAGSVDSRSYRRDRGRRLAPSSAARRHSHYFAKPS